MFSLSECAAVVFAVNDRDLALRHEIMRRMADEDSDLLIPKLLLEAADLPALSELRVGVYET